MTFNKLLKTNVAKREISVDGVNEERSIKVIILPIMKGIEKAGTEAV